MSDNDVIKVVFFGGGFAGVYGTFISRPIVRTASA